MASKLPEPVGEAWGSLPHSLGRTNPADTWTAGLQNRVAVFLSLVPVGSSVSAALVYQHKRIGARPHLTVIGANSIKGYLSLCYFYHEKVYLWLFAARLLLEAMT